MGTCCCALGRLVKWYLTRGVIAYRFNERGEISQYQKYWYRHIGVFYRGLSTFVDTCACCVLCAVHFSGHLRVFVYYVLSTLVDAVDFVKMCAGLVWRKSTLSGT